MSAIRSRLLLAQGGWDTYDGSFDGAWTQLTTGGLLANWGGLDTWPNPGMGSFAQATLGCSINIDNGSTNYASRLSISGLTPALVGSVYNFPGGVTSRGVSFQDDLTAWLSGFGATKAVTAASDVTAFSTNYTGAGGSGSDTGVTIQYLDTNRSIYASQNSSGSGQWIILSRSGTTFTAGTPLSSAGVSVSAALAAPLSASVSIGLWVDTSGNLQCGILSHAATTITLSNTTQVVAAANWAGPAATNYTLSAAPLDGFGNIPNRVLAWWQDGAKTLKACILRWDGATLTVGAAVTLASLSFYGGAAGPSAGQKDVIVTSPGTVIIGIGNPSHQAILPVHYNTLSSSTLLMAGIGGIRSIPMGALSGQGVNFRYVSSSRILAITRDTSSNLWGKVLCNGQGG